MNWEQNLLSKFYKAEFFKCSYPDLSKKSSFQDLIETNESFCQLYELDQYNIKVNHKSCLYRKINDFRFQYYDVEENQTFYLFCKYFSKAETLFGSLSQEQLEHLNKLNLIDGYSLQTIENLNRVFIVSLFCQETFSRLWQAAQSNFMLGEALSLYGKQLTRHSRRQTRSNLRTKRSCFVR